jgi:type IV secretion system protein VirD4
MKELLTKLSHSNSEECRAIANGLAIMGENERLLGSVFATFSSNLRFLRLPSIRDSLCAKGFSFSELLKPKTALFLQFEEVHQTTTSRFFSVIVGHLLRYMIMKNPNKRPVLMMLDEIGNAEVVNDLAGKLNTMRSRNLPTWLYWQSIEQMQKYGKAPGESANIILGACDLNMTFRLNDNATREYFSKKVGTQQVTKISVSDGIRTSTKETQNVIEPYELGELEQHMALYSYRGDYWIGRATPYFEEK